MKKLIVSIILILIIVLACVYFYKGALERFALTDEEIDYDSYNKLFYYNQLTDEQKKIYVYIDVAVRKLETEIRLGITKNKNVVKDVQKALDAIYNDRPEYYFLPNEYNVKTLTVKSIKYAYVEMNYDVKGLNDKKKKDNALEEAVQNVLDNCVTYGMSDVEKEIAIHDYLLKHVEYYEYTDMKKIPNVKHTSYGALVEKEAVCDGISKAMTILLNRAGIDTIVVLGSVKDTMHAWNIVKLGNEYYHLDATSDTVKLNGDKYIIHDCFNVNDADISATHQIEKTFDVPKCDGEEYNYYTYNDYNVDYTESMRSKLTKIIAKQANSPVFEVRIDPLYSTDHFIEMLYLLDFNNWQTDRKTSVTYHNSADIYVFENTKQSK